MSDSSPANKVFDAIEILVIHEVAKRDGGQPNDTMVRASARAKRYIQEAFDEFAADIIRVVEARNGTKNSG